MKKNNIKSIDEALKVHYTTKSLSDIKLSKLLAIQMNAIKNQQSVSPTIEMTEAQTTNRERLNKTVNKKNWVQRLLPSKNTYRYAFYATAFLLLVSLSSVYKLLDEIPSSKRIMAEIAYNHNQDMPIEVSSNSIGDISEYLSKLSFSIVLPSIFSEPKWQFLGGRYCMLDGKLAALLKIKNTKDNQVYTLYQAKSDVNSPRDNALNDLIEGVDVSIWREQGLLLGLAMDNKMPIR